RRADARTAPVPRGPSHTYSVRWAPGSTGWGRQSKFTARPSARPAAHSTCGQRARGAEWTYTTPRDIAAATFLSVRQMRLPHRPDVRSLLLGAIMPGRAPKSQACGSRVGYFASA